MPNPYQLDVRGFIDNFAEIGDTIDRIQRELNKLGTIDLQRSRVYYDDGKAIPEGEWRGRYWWYAAQGQVTNPAQIDNAIKNIETAMSQVGNRFIVGFRSEVVISHDHFIPADFFGTIANPPQYMNIKE